MSSTVVKQVFLAKSKNFPKSDLLTANGLEYLSETDNSNKAPLSLLEAPSSQPDYKSYLGRLRTFANWPNREIAKEVLAKAGFYYKNESDVVQCAYCYIEGYHWVAGDDPLNDHRSWSPACPFVMNSIEPSSSSSSRAADTCGLYGVEILPNSVPEDEIHLERLGIHRNKGPAHPEKFSNDARLATFESWPKSMKQTPKELADAGFYYLGTGDQTICFHCGGGLKDWEQNDSPWEQHALWFPKCSYVYLKKGPEYIQEVKDKRNPRASASSSEPETKESAKEEEAEEAVASSSDEEKDKTGEEKTLCKICYKNEVGVVFLPCGHVVACVECSSALKNCAICRKPLEATVRAFLS